MHIMYKSQEWVGFSLIKKFSPLICATENVTKQSVYFFQRFTLSFIFPLFVRIHGVVNIKQTSYKLKYPTVLAVDIGLENLKTKLSAIKQIAWIYLCK